MSKSNCFLVMTSPYFWSKVGGLPMSGSTRPSFVITYMCLNFISNSHHVKHMAYLIKITVYTLKKSRTFNDIETRLLSSFVGYLQEYSKKLGMNFHTSSQFLEQEAGTRRNRNFRNKKPSCQSHFAGDWIWILNIPSRYRVEARFATCYATHFSAINELNLYSAMCCKQIIGKWHFKYCNYRIVQTYPIFSSVCHN